MVEQLSSNLSLHGDLIHRLDSDPDGSCSYQAVARTCEVKVPKRIADLY